jgi:hypothetical protein
VLVTGEAFNEFAIDFGSLNVIEGNFTPDAESVAQFDNFFAHGVRVLDRNVVVKVAAARDARRLALVVVFDLQGHVQPLATPTE